VKRLDKYHQAVRNLHRAFDPHPGMPNFHEESAIRSYAEAMNWLSSQLKQSAVMLGIGEYSDPNDIDG
jgi:hypothetical protein